MCGLLVWALAGCSTTQQQAARLRLNDARLRQSQLPTVVRAVDPQIRLDGVTLVRQGATAALVVTVENRGSRPVSDLSLVTGYRVGRRLVYLNRAPGRAYFRSHLPGVAGHSSLRWVLTGGLHLPARARPFALVGRGGAVAPALPASLPRIRVGSTGTPTSSAVRLHIVNASSVPQYELQVYAVIQRGGRVLAAGQLSLAELASGASETVTLRVVGRPDGGKLTVMAPPTIFN